VRRSKAEKNGRCDGKSLLRKGCENTGIFWLCRDARNENRTVKERKNRELTPRSRADRCGCSWRRGRG
jgi:hypothetical protein